MRRMLLLCLLTAPLAGAPAQTGRTVTFSGLVAEMTDLDRLTRLPDVGYRAIQFSSYDRRSTRPDRAGWFANEDGFGGEPVPGFERVLREPDATGIGDYLVCDVQGPGAIQRLWTAGFTGRIRLFIDGSKAPAYDGPAEGLFRDPAGALLGISLPGPFFRQADASYFPIPFASGCRMEWTGNLKELHFYHVGIRLYEPGTEVSTITTESPDSILSAVGKVLSGDSIGRQPAQENLPYAETRLAPGKAAILWEGDGPAAICELAVRVGAADLESALRQCILLVSFDNSPVPQVCAPVGDFFGSAPGLCPFASLPFRVEDSGFMRCYFRMPYRDNALVCLENRGGEAVAVSSRVITVPQEWREGTTLHFAARWRISHDLTASGSPVYDIPYLLANGRGRLVGAAAFIGNPSPVPSSWGDWWGEGDEKIFIDGETFPSFFGTGSEDYFNYSWSSPGLFAFPYCGQTRNDGPGNRGHVSNYRWHIADDIPFGTSVAFFMELLTHGRVPGFSYGRIVYLYALPGLVDDQEPITGDDIRKIPYENWEPEAYEGSEGYAFTPAERLAVRSRSANLEPDRLAAGGGLLLWKPFRGGEQLRFLIDSEKEVVKTDIGITLSVRPDGGTVRLTLNGAAQKLNGEETANLSRPGPPSLDSYFTGPVSLRKGRNVLTLEEVSGLPGRVVGVDFFWLRR